MNDTIKILECRLSADRYRVTISALEEPLLVSAELVHRYRLKEGIVITEPQLQQLKAESELAECDRAVARLLAVRDHSCGEIKVKLARRGFGHEAVQVTIGKYRERGLLDDAHYAHTLARSLLARNPSGRPFLTAQLQRRFIPRDLAEKTVALVFGDLDEIELAVSSLRRRWSHFRQFELETARTKSYSYLARRGIGYEAAKIAFERLCDSENSDQG